MARSQKRQSSVERIADGKRWTVITGDVKEVCKTLDANSFHAVLCDPPYGLSSGKTCTWDDIEAGRAVAKGGFMGKAWDSAVPGPSLWAEVLRVLLPGAPLVAFFGARTYHRGACAIEDGGFEACDMFSWLHGQGWPKGLDMAKAFDKRRHDRDQILVVTAWVAEMRDRAGITNGDIDRAFGLTGMAGHWTSAKSQPLVPTLEQIPKLLQVLRVPLDEVPEEIRELVVTLNGRKGEKGEAWKNAEITGYREGTDFTKVRPVSLAAQGITEAATTKFATKAPTSDLAKLWAGYNTQFKPAHEKAHVARAPDTVRGMISRVAWDVRAAILELPSYAKHAEGSFGSLARDSVGDVDSARWRALLASATPDASFEVMGTWRSESGLPTSLSIAWSWLLILAELWDLESTSTIETKSKTTIASRISSFFPLKITPESIIRGATNVPGKTLDAWRAERFFEFAGHVCAVTRELSATEPVTSKDDDGALLLSGEEEPAALMRKPFPGTFARNAEEHGVGPFNIDACRVGSNERFVAAHAAGGRETFCAQKNAVGFSGGTEAKVVQGRYPTNVILGHLPECRQVGTAPDPEVVTITKSTGEVTSENRAATGANYGRVEVGAVGRPDRAVWECSPDCMVSRLDAQTGNRPSAMTGRAPADARLQVSDMTSASPKAGEVLGRPGGTGAIYADDGGASRFYEQTAWQPGEFEEFAEAFERFYYCAKASNGERGTRNEHPTLKPMALMRYLATLLRPPRGGRILVPFCGSGSEMLGAMLAGWDDVVGIELDPKMADVARWRIANATIKRTTKVIG